MRELKAARERAGLTQYDLAARLGKSQSYVGKCELGERRIDMVQLRDFCSALDVPFLDFVRGVEEAIVAEVPLGTSNGEPAVVEASEKESRSQ